MPALTDMLLTAIEANWASQRAMGAQQMKQLRAKAELLSVRRQQAMEKCLSGVFSDSDTKRLLAKIDEESDSLQSQIALAEGSELAPEQVIKTGLEVLQDMGRSGRALT